MIVRLNSTDYIVLLITKTDLFYLTVPVIEMITGGEEHVTHMTTSAGEQTIVHEVHEGDLTESQTIIIGKSHQTVSSSVSLIKLCVVYNCVAFIL